MFAYSHYVLYWYCGKGSIQIENQMTHIRTHILRILGYMRCQNDSGSIAEVMIQCLDRTARVTVYSDISQDRMFSEANSLLSPAITKSTALEKCQGQMTM